MNRNINTGGIGSRQGGAALIVGLILLLVLTILAVSGVMTSTLELRMVGNTQLQERAFQAAEVAIEDALANPVLTTAAPIIQAPIPNPNAVDDQYEYVLRYVCETPVGAGYSIGTGFFAYHFQVDATGRTTSGNALAQHSQNFYIVGPTGTENC
jgi:type IV pilus assembly protein PilX